MTIFTATHPESITPFIPAGTLAHTVTRFLNTTQQTLCATLRDEAAAKDVCPTYANCVLDQLGPYTQSGLGVGTTLLTLIPAALSLLPAAEVDADALWRVTRGRGVLRWGLLVLGGFSGYLQAGRGLRALRRGVEEGKGWKGAARGRSLSVTAVILLILTIVLACLITYASVVIGFLGVVTWACDRQPLSLSWTLPKAAPVLLEAVLVIIARWRIRDFTRPNQLSNGQEGGDESTVELRGLQTTKADNDDTVYDREHLMDQAQSTKAAAQSRQLASELKIAEMICRGLEGAIVLWGTAVLGSMLLIDGIPGMIFLLLIPALYGAMQLCMSEIVRLIQ